MINQTKAKVLSNLLADEDIKIRINIDIPTAYFELDSRELHIPTLDPETPESIYMGILIHEVSHALFSSRLIHLRKDKDKGPIAIAIWHYVNVIEDVRCENLIKKKYKGAASILSRCYSDMLERSIYFEKIDKNTKFDNVNFPKLVDRINYYYKLPITQHVKFYNSKEEWLRDRCDEVKDVDEVFELAKELYIYDNDALKKKFFDGDLDLNSNNNLNTNTGHVSDDSNVNIDSEDDLEEAIAEYIIDEFEGENKSLTYELNNPLDEYGNEKDFTGSKQPLFWGNLEKNVQKSIRRFEI